MGTVTVTRTGTEWLRKKAAQVTDGASLPVTVTVAAAVEVEAWLQKHAVRYAPPSPIPMHLIDENSSRKNQARADPIVADSVERFAVAMRAGEAFPPIVCFPRGGKVVIIDGNNRQAAARKAGLDAIAGIIVAEDTPSELIQLLTVEANAHHGVTPALAWRVQQAFHLCRIGFPDAKSAAAAGISIQQLRSARTVEEAEQRAKVLKVHTFTELPNASKEKLGRLRDDAVFYQAAKVASETGMTGDEIGDMLRHVKQLTSEGARIEYIGSVAKTRGTARAARRAAGKRERIHSPQHALASAVGKILAVDVNALVRAIYTTHDRDAVNNRLTALQRKLTELQLGMSTLDHLGES